MFTFQEAIAQLQQTHPTIPIGNTALPGSEYYERAQHMTFTQLDDDRFQSQENPNMWVYLSKIKNRLCCGDKP